MMPQRHIKLNKSALRVKPILNTQKPNVVAAVINRNKSNPESSWITFLKCVSPWALFTQRRAIRYLAKEQNKTFINQEISHTFANRNAF